MSCVAIIPARGGSKRIPRKNIRLFHGKPIIAYSIEAALECGKFDDIFVSTEDHEIAGAAIKYGARLLLRDARLCDDSIGTQEVTSSALSDLINSAMLREPWAFEYQRIDKVCCIYATAPTMIAADIGAMYAASCLAEWRDISYVDGWMYWGTAKRFLESPELQGTDFRADLTERLIDINTWDDWHRAERMYAELYPERVCATA